MKIKIYKEQLRVKKDVVYEWVADCMDLMGMPPIGRGSTPENAMADLFLRLINDDRVDWLNMIDRSTYEVINLYVDSETKITYPMENNHMWTMVNYGDVYALRYNDRVVADIRTLPNAREIALKMATGLNLSSINLVFDLKDEMMSNLIECLRLHYSDKGIDDWKLIDAEQKCLDTGWSLSDIEHTWDKIAAEAFHTSYDMYSAMHEGNSVAAYVGHSQDKLHEYISTTYFDEEFFNTCARFCMDKGYHCLMFK